MILAFELTWSGGAHAPINSAMLQIIAAACPSHTVRLHAAPSHLDELRSDRHLAACASIQMVPVTLSDAYRGRTQIVSPARFRREFAILREALRAVPASEPCLIVLLSATSTAIWAAAVAARRHGGVAGIQVMLHGNLNDAVGWRTRNPLLRRFDLAATFRARLPAPVRYCVFETNIAERLAQIAPGAAAFTDLLPHPVSLGDLPDDFDQYPSLGDPVRVGFVGQGTRSKGFDIFLDAARRISARHLGRVAFHMIGKVQTELMEDALRAPLEEPPSATMLSRESFTQRLAGVHYVMLPFRPGYYDLSASGGLIDAVTWLKPVIATDVALMQAFATDHGDIGHISADIVAALDDALAAHDTARYAAQVEGLRKLRASRTPDALAPVFRAAIRAGFPTFSPGPAGAAPPDPHSLEFQ